jgi:rRNA-processing protein FCF1
MAQKYSLILDEEFIKYCLLNKLDVEKEAERIFNEAFLKEKYGTKPTIIYTTPLPVQNTAREEKKESIQNNIEEIKKVIKTDIYGDD